MRKPNETFMFTDSHGFRHLLRAVMVPQTMEDGRNRCSRCFFEQKFNHTQEKDNKCYMTHIIALTGSCDYYQDNIRNTLYFQHIKSKPPK